MFVIGERNVLKELAGGACALPIQCLLDNPVKGFDQAHKPFVVVDPSDLEFEEGGKSYSDRQDLITRFSGLATKLLDERNPVALIWIIDSSEDMKRLSDWFHKLIANVKKHVQEDRHSGACWTLVIVAMRPLNNDDNNVLEKVKSLKVNNLNASKIFQCCYLMTPQLRASKNGEVFQSKRVWPVAVGYLLMSLCKRTKKRSDGSCPLMAWSAQVLRSVGDRSIYDERILEWSNKVIYPKFDSQPKKLIETSINVDGAPGHVEDDKYSGNSSPDLIEFAESSSGSGIEAVEKRIVDWPNKWKVLIDCRFSKFGAEREADRCKPFSDGGINTKIVSDSWTEIGKNLTSVMLNAGGACCAAPETTIARQLDIQEKHWNAMLRHTAKVEAAIVATAGVAEEFDLARRGFAGLGWRLFSVVSVSMFVGILVTTAISGLTNSSWKGSAIAGFVSSTGALFIAIVMRWTEHRAGAIAAKTLSKEIVFREENIHEGLRKRLEIGSGAVKTSRIVAWRVMTTSIQALAGRLNSIVNDAINSGLQPQGSGQNQVDSDTRLERARFEELSSSAMKGMALNAVLDYEDKIKKEIEQLKKELTIKWSAFSNEWDPLRVGAFPARQTWQLLASEARLVRKRLNDFNTKEIVSKACDPNAKADFDQFAKPDADFPLLSVRTEQYSLGGVVLPRTITVSPLICRSKDHLKLPSSGFVEDPQLDAASGILLISIQECEVEAKWDEERLAMTYCEKKREP